MLERYTGIAGVSVYLSVTRWYWLTSSSAVAQRPRDASCLSPVSFDHSFFYSYLLGLQIYHFVQLNVVLLSWHNVEASCHKHFVVVCREQQTTPLSSDECYQLATVPHSCEYNTWRSNRCQHATKPDVGRELRFLPTPPAFYEWCRFQLLWMAVNSDFKGTPLLYVEYLRNDAR